MPAVARYDARDWVVGEHAVQVTRPAIGARHPSGRAQVTLSEGQGMCCAVASRADKLRPC